MSELVIAEKEDLVSIADAIRSSTGSTNTFSLNAMATSIATMGGLKPLMVFLLMKTAMLIPHGTT